MAIPSAQHHLGNMNFQPYSNYFLTYFLCCNRRGISTVSILHNSPSPCICSSFFPLPEGFNFHQFLLFIQIDIFSEQYSSIKIILNNTLYAEFKMYSICSSLDGSSLLDFPIISHLSYMTSYKMSTFEWVIPPICSKCKWYKKKCGENPCHSCLLT